MKNFLRSKQLICTAIVILIIGSIFLYSNWYLPYKRLRDGYMVVNKFDCPKDHPIKAHIGKDLIYHLRGDPYYKRTSASNGYCFDTAYHAEQQGFRKPYNR